LESVTGMPAVCFKKGNRIPHRIEPRIRSVDDDALANGLIGPAAQPGRSPPAAATRNLEALSPTLCVGSSTSSIVSRTVITVSGRRAEQASLPSCQRTDHEARAVAKLGVRVGRNRPNSGDEEDPHPRPGCSIGDPRPAPSRSDHSFVALLGTRRRSRPPP
jgi:hypothetical protein